MNTHVRYFSIRAICLLLILTSIIMVSGCATPKPAPVVTEAPKPTVVVTEAPKPLKVALVTNQKFGDLGPLDSMKAGLEKAKADFGIEIKALESTEPAVYEANVRSMAEQGYDVVMVTFSPMIDAVVTIAPEFPYTKFIIIYSTPLDPPMTNVRTIALDYNSISFVIGAIGGLMTETGKLGYVSGGDIPDINRNYNAFMQGAKYQNPNVTGEIVYANGFGDPANGKEVALMLYGKGVDIIATNAALTSTGVIDAAKQTGKFVIGDTTDNSSLAPANIIVTGLVLFGDIVYQQVKEILDGSWVSGHYTADFSNAGIEVSQMDSFAKAGPPALADKVTEAKTLSEELIKKIISGEIQITTETTIVK